MHQWLVFLWLYFGFYLASRFQNRKMFWEYGVCIEIIFRSAIFKYLRVLLGPLPTRLLWVLWWWVKGTKGWDQRYFIHLVLPQNTFNWVWSTFHSASRVSEKFMSYISGTKEEEKERDWVPQSKRSLYSILTRHIN